MCKLMIMSGITDETQANAWAFTKAMAKEMSSPNSTEKDGLGYAAIDNEGKLFGERWVNNKEAFQHRNAYGTEVDTHFLRKFRILNKEKIYGNFGTLNENMRSITLHSRSATNEVGYKNTHPFVEGDTSVIHNGVIYNDDDLIKKYSTCDSEVILHQYIKYNIANKPAKFKKVANKLEGYYALGIFSKTTEGKVILDIVKDSTTRLDAFFIKELNTIVFATPRYQMSPVEDACKTLGFTIVSKYEVRANRLIRLDALTGETLAYESFKPKDFNRATKTTTVPDNKWNTDNRNTNNYPYATPPVETKFEQVFPKPDTSKPGNVIDMTTHSRAKHDEATKERQLEEMILSNHEYTEEEVAKMINEHGGIIVKGNEDNRFGDDGDSVWQIDERLTWHKKTLA